MRIRDTGTSAARPLARRASLRRTLFLAPLALACGGEAPEPSVDAAPPATEISGVYDVSGVTVDLRNGNRRDISGTVVLDADGDGYTATYELSTAFPTQQGALQADVIGEGSGEIRGRLLIGDARTQVIVSTVPGVDPGFAFVPRTTTTRIVNQSVTTLGADGSVEIDIENRPAEGETYAPTRTTLKGHRIDTAAAETAEPDAPPPADPHAS